MPSSSLELPKSSKVVGYDKLDEYKFKENIESREKEFYELVDAKKYDEKNITDKSVGGDMMNVFATLFRRNWDWAEGEEAEDSELKTFIDELTKTEEFENIRSITTRNDSASFAASMKLIERFDRVLKEELKKQKEAQENGTATASGNAEVRARVRAAARLAEEAAEDADKADRAFGCGSDDPTNTKGPKELKERIKKIRDEFGDLFFRLLISMIGRSKASAESVMSVYTDKGAIQPVGIEQGGDLAMMVPSEMLKYEMSPELFILEWMEKKLQQVRNEGEESKDGPIVLAVDQSGSMDGVPRAISCALLYGLWLVARREKRKLAFIPFSSSVGNIVEIGGTENIDDVLLEFMNGGTNFDAPLVKAVNYINEVPDFDTADILFVTDGVSCISESTVKMVEGLEGKLRILVAQIAENSLSCDNQGNLIKGTKKYNIGRRSFNDEPMRSVFETVTPKNRIFHIDGPQSWDTFCEQAFATPGGNW